MKGLVLAVFAVAIVFGLQSMCAGFFPVDGNAPGPAHDGLASETASLSHRADVDAAMPVSGSQSASGGTMGAGTFPSMGMVSDRYDSSADTAGAKSPNWIVQIGVGRNSYPGGGDDLPNFLGVYEGAIDDYGDAYDVVDGGAPPHGLNLIFRGDQYGNNPTYPETGLAWDVREPFDFPFKIWKVQVILPNGGHTYDLYYDYDPMGYPLPDGWCCFVDMDGEVNGENYMDLGLYELHLTHQKGYVLTGLAQTGGSETWYALVGHYHSSRAYVDCSAPGPYHDGLTWDTAFLTIEEGIRAVDPGSQVWVADGTYVENIVMRQSVAIYGGFLGAEPGGHETELDQRDFVNNVTTIDGNWSGSCVVMAVDARVDGFTVTNGSGELGDDGFCYGGGFHCFDLGESGVIANNRITRNGGAHGSHETGQGSGIYCYRSSPLVTDNAISDNYLCWEGGGIACVEDASPVVTNNTIIHNSAAAAGGGLSSGGSSVVTNNTISYNEGGFCGGGIYCVSSSITVSNNVIVGNTSARGAGIYCGGSTTVTNNVIVGNKTWGGLGEGGGMFCESSSVTVSNNIVIENASGAGGGIYADSSPILSHNDVWNNSPDNYFGCEPGEGDISTDPMLFDPEYDDFHLRPGSPCIDSGDNHAPGLPEHDFEGDPRILDGDGDGNAVVDMGADEFVPHVSPLVLVDQNAPGPTHDGLTWDSAFLTIQRGVDAATPGGDVWVADGTYVENVVMGDGVTVYGGFLGAEPGGYETELEQRDFANNVTTIDGNQSSARVVTVVDAVLDGFTVTNGAGGGVSCSGSARVTCNIIAGNGCTGWTNGAGIACAGSSVVAHNVIVDNVALVSDDWLGGGGIFCADTSTVANNIIAGNSAEATDEHYLPYGGGVLCHWGGAQILTGNTIFGNTTHGDGGGIFIYCDVELSPVVANNVVVGNSAPAGGGISSHSWQPELSHNDVWGNSRFDYYGCEPGEGDISADPLFLDPQKGNWHLSFFSPCIDAGTNYALGLPEMDWEGEPRVHDGDGDEEEPGVYATVDIGADEFVPLLGVAPDPEPECQGPLFGLPPSGYPGWVWFSIPIDPDGCCGYGDCYDPETLLGFSCSGHLWRWDKYGKCSEVYQLRFNRWDLAVGESYLLRLWTEVSNPWYLGVSPYCPRTFEFKLGRMGWTWIGMPGLTELGGDDFMSSVRVQYPSDDTGCYRTSQEDYDATPGNWITWGWAFFDTYLQAPKTFTPYAPFGNRTCYPWVGYRVWVNVGSASDEDDPDQVTLIWP